MNEQFFRRLVGFAAISGAIGVIIGAFGAHSLKSRIPPESMEVLKTGVQYLFIHALACVLIGVLARTVNGDRMLKFSGMSFIAGIILFSGSLFILSTKDVTGIDISAIGLVTPLGGLCFMAGWICLATWGIRTYKK